MDFKKLNEELSAFCEDTMVYDLDGTSLCKLQFPDGTIREEKVKIHGKTRCGGRYHSNIYGVDACYAVGGYEPDDNFEDLDPDEFEVDDEEYERFGVEDGEIKVLDIIQEIDMELGDCEVEPDDYEPDYDPYDDRY